MANIVYGVPLSPFVRKVLAVLEHKAIPYQLKSTLPGDASAGYRRMHPLGKIPAFADDWVMLADSSVIVAYLEERYPRPSVLPASITDRARARWLEEYADTRLHELLGPGLFFERLVKPGMMGKPCNEALVQRTIKTQLPAEQDYLEQQVPAAGFFFAEGLGLADISVAGVFLNASYAGYQVDPARWPRLAAYLQRVWQAPAIQRRMPDETPIVEMLKSRA
ncbi:MAG: glutathione S-transferase family protein [Gammaproteobacteria bacterium]|nr:MAG: glutathione S-transferase family protein [Gammaproteobacteria bacterium]